MNSERRTERIAGILLIVSFILYLFHIITAFTHGVKLPTMYLYILYGFSMGSAGAVLYLVFRRHDTVLALLGAFWLMVHSLLVIIEASIIQAGLTFPENFSYIPERTSPAAISAIEVTMNRIGRSGYVSQGIGLLLIAVLAMRTRVVGPVIGWLGIVGSAGAFVGGLVTLAYLVTYASAGKVFPFIALFTFLFMLILGCNLYSRGLAQQEP